MIGMLQGTAAWEALTQLAGPLQQRPPQSVAAAPACKAAVTRKAAVALCSLLCWMPTFWLTGTKPLKHSGKAIAKDK